MLKEGEKNLPRIGQEKLKLKTNLYFINLYWQIFVLFSVKTFFIFLNVSCHFASQVNVSQM